MSCMDRILLEDENLELSISGIIVSLKFKNKVGVPLTMFGGAQCGDDFILKKQLNLKEAEGLWDSASLVADLWFVMARYCSGPIDISPAGVELENDLLLITSPCGNMVGTDDGTIHWYGRSATGISELFRSVGLQAKNTGDSMHSMVNGEWLARHSDIAIQRGMEIPYALITNITYTASDISATVAGHKVIVKSDGSSMCDCTSHKFRGFREDKHAAALIIYVINQSSGAPEYTGPCVKDDEKECEGISSK